MSLRKVCAALCQSIIEFAHVDSVVEDSSSEKSDSDAEGDDSGPHESVEDFLTDDEFTDEAEEEEGEFEEQEDEDEESGSESDEQAKSPQKATASAPGLALPGTGDAVNLPGAGHTIHLTDSLPSDAKDDSTTPPGTPADKTGPANVAAPVPVNAASPGFNLGVAKPANKPTRSSPLANAPISGDDDSEEDTTAKLPQASAKASTPAGASSKPASPASQPSNTKSPSPAPAKGEPSGKEPASRAKTPPLGSLFGTAPAAPKPAPFTLPPAKASPGPSNPP